MAPKWVSDFSSHIGSLLLCCSGEAQPQPGCDLSSSGFPPAKPDCPQCLRVESQIHKVPQCSHMSCCQQTAFFQPKKCACSWSLSHFSSHTHFEVFISYSLCSLSLPSRLKVTAQSRCLWIYHATCLASGLKIKSSFWVHFSPNNVAAWHISVLSLSPMMTGTYMGRVLSHKIHLEQIQVLGEKLGWA